MSKELIERLRNPNPLSLAGPGIIGVMREAADAIESQAREIEYHKAYAEECMDSFDIVMAEKRELRAALVDCQHILHYVKPMVNVDTQNDINVALTRCKEVL
jgi:hypothetical protein